MQLDGLEELTTLKKRDHRGPYTTERGVILKYTKVSGDTVRKAWSTIPVPKPPMVYITDRGREEPNPADPGYNSELAQYNSKITIVIRTIYLMRGVDVQLPLPQDIIAIESEEWHEGLEEYLDIPKGRLARKAAWLMDYILNDTERDEIIEDLMIFSGLTSEAQVEEAMSSFRSNGVSEADKQVPTN